MHTIKGLVLGTAALLIVSCSPYKGKKFQNEDQGGNIPVVVNEDPGTTPTADAKPGEANTPTEAQKDNKTFIALTDEEALHGLKEGDAQIKIVCDRNVGKTNLVLTAFCTNNIRPKSLVEMQTALGLTFPANPTPGRGNNGGNGNGPAFAIQGHSSSLVGKFVSAINPRVIMMDAAITNIAVGFVRGEQFSEIAVKNADNTFDFFLVGFKQACNAKPEGCSMGELLTDAVEKNWTAFTLYQDEDLKNSIVDCRHCHQPDGPQSPKILRMQELRNPWTHWFRDNTDGDGLRTDYQAAWGTDGVGGIPGSMIASSDPQQLENFLRNNQMIFTENRVGGGNPQAQQPNEFLTNAIRGEVAGNAGGRSPTWEALRDRVKTRKDNTYTLPTVGTPTSPVLLAAGNPKNYIPIPFRELRVTDPALLATFTKQVQDFKAGTVTLAQFKDTREIFPADQQRLADVGFAVGPTETPQDILNMACAQCHQSSLDQTQSRAKFNAVDFTKMANLNQELDVAIARLKLGFTPERLKAEGLKILGPDGSQVAMLKGEHLLTMPPRRFKSLTDTQIDAVIKFLESQKK